MPDPLLTLHLEVALSSGPFDPVTDPDFTDLTDRILAFKMQRGRQDQLDTFETGTVDITLDNTDRMLDPDWDGGLVYRLDGEGLPLCPVRVTVDWDGDNYPLFYGYLGPEGWRQTGAAYGKEATASLFAVDALSLMSSSVDYPIDVWEVLVRALHPDWWIRGDGDDPIVSDGQGIPDRAGTGSSALVVADPGLGIYMGDSIITPQSQNPAMLLESTTALFSPAADVMPDGNENDATILVWFKVGDGATDQELIRQQTFGGDVRWRALLVPGGGGPGTGTVRLDIYDGAGTVISDITVAEPGGGWDDDDPHLLLIRIDGGIETKMWVNGVGASETTDPIDYVRTSDLIIEASENNTWFDEVTYWRRRLDDDEIAAILLATGGGAGPFYGDNFRDRLSHWFAVATAGIVDITIYDSSEWHIGPLDEDLPHWDVGRYGGVPTTLYGALFLTADSHDGALWATRGGSVRVRSITALTADAYTSQYVTPVAHLTDEPSPDPGLLPVRRSKVEFSGTRLDRVVNRSIRYFGVPDNVYAPSTVSMTREDQESIARFGPRAESKTSIVQDWSFQDYLARYQVFSYRQPPVEVEAVTVWPLIDEGAAEFVASRLELERAVQVTHTPPVGDPTVMLLNVQREEWSWVGLDCTVTLNLAASDGSGLMFL